MIFFLLGLGLGLPDGQFSPAPPQMYYTVITVSGVNLRAKPQTGSRVLLVLPVNSSGKILEYISEKPTKIQGRHGFWVKAEYGNSTGYLFTGFVTISDSKSRAIDDEETTYLEGSSQFRQLEREEVSIRLKQKTYLKTEFRSHTVFITKAPPRDIGEDPGCIGRTELRQGMVKNKIIGHYYDLDAVYIERLSSQTQYPDQLLLDITHCSCCCGSRSKKALFFGSKKVLVAPFSIKPRKAQCGADRIESSLDWRFDNESKVLLLELNTPFCSFSGENHEIDYKSPEIRDKKILEIKPIDGDYAIKKYQFPSQEYSTISDKWNSLKPASP